MSILPGAAHRLGLYLLATGLLGVIVGVGLVAFTALAIVVADAGKDEKVIAGVLGCSVFLLVPSVLLVWGGIVVRRRAIAAGSRFHRGESWRVRTSRSDSARPSFLAGNDEAEQSKS